MTRLRYFISDPPRFGSYKEPQRHKVEQSPYYWWWYALTLNSSYQQLCAQAEGSGTAELSGAIGKVYADWGDVRYEGDRYKAFCDWWRNRVNTDEERGAYLFAEPLRGKWTRVVETSDDAEAVLADSEQILIALPLNQQRYFAHKSLNRIIAKHIAEQKGRAIRDPRSSNARYHLSTAVQVRALKTAFDVYDLRNGCAIDPIPQRISARLPHNVRIARAVGLTYKTRLTEQPTPADEHRALSTIVARHIRTAKTCIENAALGMFP